MGDVNDKGRAGETARGTVTACGRAGTADVEDEGQFYAMRRRMTCL